MILDVARRTERPRTTVEERVDAIEARRTIHDLVMLYGWLCDARLWDELLDHYTDDFERTLLGTLDEHVKGKEAIRPLYVAPQLGYVMPRIDFLSPTGEVGIRHDASDFEQTTSGVYFPRQCSKRIYTDPKGKPGCLRDQVERLPIRPR